MPEYKNVPYQYRNPVWADAAHTKIDCEINHPSLGWIPFTATLDDREPMGRVLYTAIAVAGPAPYDSTKDVAFAALVAAEEAANAALRATAMDTTKPAEERLNALLELLGV